MSKQSEAVKAWRKRTKQRIIDAMGGRCVCCNYKRSSAALGLHHLDPSEKELTFAGVRANPISWARIVVELRKCVLVCANCHAEIEEGTREVPKNAARFDESYCTYQSTFGNEREIQVL